jgi:hypothetical protein
MRNAALVLSTVMVFGVAAAGAGRSTDPAAVVEPTDTCTTAGASITTTTLTSTTLTSTTLTTTTLTSTTTGPSSTPSSTSTTATTATTSSTSSTSTTLPWQRYPTNGVTPLRARTMHVYSRIETTDPVVFLTIDDGFFRDPRVPALLEERHAPATLFLISATAATDPAYFGRFLTMGGSINGHTAQHACLPGMALADQKWQICAAMSTITHTYGSVGLFFRPPRGESDDTTFTAARACGVRAVLFWLTGDPPRRHHHPSLPAIHVRHARRAVRRTRPARPHSRPPRGLPPRRVTSPRELKFAWVGAISGRGGVRGNCRGRGPRPRRPRGPWPTPGR